MKFSVRLILAVALSIATQSEGRVVKRGKNGESPAECEEICHYTEDRQGSVSTSCRGSWLDIVATCIPSSTHRLDISDNVFKHLTKETFGNLNIPNLHHLICKNCHIETMDENIFGNAAFLSSLKKFDLFGNNLGNTKQVIETLKSLNSLRFVDLRSNPNLDCQEVKNTLVDITVLCDYGRTTGMDVEITSEPTIDFTERNDDDSRAKKDSPSDSSMDKARVIGWDNTEMVQMDCKDECQYTTGRTELVSTSCKGIRTDIVPKCIHPNTYRLDISDNLFTHMTKKTFGNLNTPRLNHLIIKKSNIETIDKDVFADTAIANSLRKLDLYENNLSNSQDLIKALTPLISLKWIDLRMNPELSCLEVKEGLAHVKEVWCDKVTIRGDRLEHSSDTTNGHPTVTSTVDLTSDSTSRTSWVPSFGLTLEDRSQTYFNYIFICIFIAIFIIVVCAVIILHGNNICRERRFLISKKMWLARFLS